MYAAVWICIYLNGVRGVGRSLETDQRAGILLVGAPDICGRLETCTYDQREAVSQTSCGLRNSSNVDVVLSLGGSQLGNHGQEEKTDTTHLVGFLLGRIDRSTFGKCSDR